MIQTSGLRGSFLPSGFGVLSRRLLEYIPRLRLREDVGLYIIDISRVNHGSSLDSVLCCFGLQVIATRPFDVLSRSGMSFKYCTSNAPTDEDVNSG